MATYTGDLYGYFSGNYFDFGGPFAANSTVTESSDNSTFNVGEVVTSPNFSPNATYSGTVEINGVDHPVFTESATSAYILIPNGEPFGATNGDPLPPITAQPITFAQIDSVCFLADTNIETPDGPVPVQSLKIGDLIVTADGSAVPVRWVGHQKIMTRFGAADRLKPVRVRAGAFGPGLPRRDLLVTSDHALVVDDLLINAGALVNGSSIDLVPMSEFEGGCYTVYHIETENHDVILAEGTPTETYIDYVQRGVFDNYCEFVELYGEDKTIPEMNMPRISAARLVPPHIRARLGLATAA